MGMVVGLLILAAVVGMGIWLAVVFKPKDDGVLDAEPAPKPSGTKGAGTGLALFKPDRIESEVKVESQAVVKLPVHTVVRTWMADSYAGEDTYHWACSCGKKDYSFVKSNAGRKAAQHCRDANAAEALKAKTNGRFSW